MSGLTYSSYFVASLALMSVLALSTLAQAGEPEFIGPTASTAHAGWVEMPAGARSAYMGIHGGTMPVSLLTSGDGRSMVTFVGRTGNDFLRILNKSSNFDNNGTLGPVRTHDVGMNIPANNATAILTARSPVGNIPVFYCTGKGFSRVYLTGQEWLPFGLSEKPLLLEGQPGRPLVAKKTSTKKYRRFLLQQRLQRPVLSVN